VFWHVGSKEYLPWLQACKFIFYRGWTCYDNFSIPFYLKHFALQPLRENEWGWHRRLAQNTHVCVREKLDVFIAVGALFYYFHWRRRFSCVVAAQPGFFLFQNAH
jgi:hypothetical protein